MNQFGTPGNPEFLPPAARQPLPGGTGRPQPVRLALWTGLLAPVLGLLTLAVAWAAIDDAAAAQLEAEFAAQGDPVTAAEILDVVHSIMLVVMGVAVLVSVGWITLVLLACRRHNWARILLTVAGCIWIALTLPSLTGTMYGGVMTALLSALNLILVAVAFGALYMPSANAYFRR